MRPDGTVMAISRRLARTCLVRDLGGYPVGDGATLRVQLRRNPDGPFVWFGICVGSLPSRRGVALLPDEIDGVRALLSLVPVPQRGVRCAETTENLNNGSPLSDLLR